MQALVHGITWLSPGILAVLQPDNVCCMWIMGGLSQQLDEILECVKPEPADNQ